MERVQTSPPCNDEVKRHGEQEMKTQQSEKANAQDDDQTHHQKIANRFQAAAAKATHHEPGNKAASAFQAVARQAVIKHRAVVHSGGRNFIIKDEVDDTTKEKKNPLRCGTCVVSSSGTAAPLHSSASMLVPPSRKSPCSSPAAFGRSRSAVVGPKQPSPRTEPTTTGDDDAAGDEDEDALRAASTTRSRSALARFPFSRFSDTGKIPARSTGFSWPEVFTTLRRRKKLRDTLLSPSASAASPSALEHEKSGGAASDLPVDSDEDVEYVEEEDGIRRRVLRFILAWEFEMFLLLLLAFDVIFLIVELELTTRKVCTVAWETGISDADAIVATNTSLGNVNCSNAPDISFSCETGRTFRLPPAYGACPFHVNEELPHAIHVAEQVIAWCSRSIIIFFGIELITLLLCAGPQIFVLHKLYLLDAFIIAVSIVLDVLAAVIHIDVASELIVLARIWRFARIVHGVGVSVHDVDEHAGEEEGEGESLLEEVTTGSETSSPGQSTKKKKKEKKKEDCPQEGEDENGDKKPAKKAEEEKDE